MRGAARKRVNGCTPVRLQTSPDLGFSAFPQVDSLRTTCSTSKRSVVQSHYAPLRALNPLVEALLAKASSMEGSVNPGEQMSAGVKSHRLESQLSHQARVGPRWQRRDPPFPRHRPTCAGQLTARTRGAGVSLTLPLARDCQYVGCRAQLKKNGLVSIANHDVFSQSHEAVLAHRGPSPALSPA